MKETEEVLVYDVLSVPTLPAQERGATANRWLTKQCQRSSQGSCPAAVENYAAIHPLWGRVAGFACGRLTTHGKVITIADLRVS